MKDFQAGVGLSRRWGTKEAGEEAAFAAIDKLDKNPKLLYNLP